MSHSLDHGNGTAAWYPDRSTAQSVMRQLRATGIPKSKISLVGRRFQWHAQLLGFYNPGQGMFRGLVVGTLFGAALGLVLGMGIFLVTGVASQTILLTLWAGMGIGALAGSVLSLARSEVENIRYVERLQTGQVLLSVHGTPEQVAQAKSIFEMTGAVEYRDHEQSVRQ